MSFGEKKKNRDVFLSLDALNLFLSKKMRTQEKRNKNSQKTIDILSFNCLLLLNIVLFW